MPQGYSTPTIGPDYRRIGALVIFVVLVFHVSHNSLLAEEVSASISDTSNASRPEVVLQIGHSGIVQCAAFSPTGTHVATFAGDIWGGGCKEIILWDLQTGRKLRSFSGHTEPVTSLAFSPDGQKLLSGSRDETAILWDVATGKQLQVFSTEHLINCVAFSPDGGKALVGTARSEAVLWDISNGKRLGVFDCHTFLGHPMVLSVAFAPNGQQFLMGLDSGTTILWDVTTGKETRRFIGHASPIRCVAFGPDSKELLTGAESKKVILWDAATGNQLKTLDTQATVNTVAFSSNGRRLFAGLMGSIICWDKVTSETLKEVPGVACIAISPNGMHALTINLLSSLNCLVVIWDIETGKALRILPSGGSEPTCAVFSADGRQILTTSNKCVIWNNDFIRAIRTFNVDYQCSDDRSISNGKHVFIRTIEGTCGIWSVATGQKQTLQRSTNAYTSQTAALCSNDKHLLLADRRTAILFDVDTGQQIRTFETGSISAIAFSANGLQFLTGHHNSTAVLWNTTTGEKLQVFKGHQGHIQSVACSPDGRRVVTGAAGPRLLFGSTGTAIVWDTATGKEICTIQGHDKTGISSAVFSADGSQVLTTAEKAGLFGPSKTDCAVLVWDASSGQKIGTFEGHTGRVNSLSVSPDGKRMLTASADGTARLWDTATRQEVLCLIDLEQGDWLVVTPDGLFDGSAGGIQKVCYRIGNGLNVVPVERFFQDFYRPGLLAAIMRGERPMPGVEIGKQLPPAVCIVTPKQGGETEENTAMIEAVIEDKGGGIKSPWVKINGVSYLSENKPMQEDNRLRWRIELPLVSGENAIEVQSASADGSWESEPARITLVRRHSTEDSDLYLLAIGVSKYAGESQNLQYAAADAKALADLFQKRGVESYGEGRVHVKTLVDDEATTKNIQAAIEDIVPKAYGKDVFILTLSGHGVMVGQRYFFLPHEFTGKGEGGWEDRVKHQGLPGDVLQTWINAVKAQKRVVVYDTCQSGGAVAVAGLSRDPFQFQRAFETFRRSTGCHVIAAATATQEAQEIRDLGHGALTYALLAGLGAVDRGPLKSRSIATKDGLIHVREWLTFAQENVPMLTKLYYGHEQIVDVFAEGRSFPVIKIDTKKEQPTSSDQK
jgi:WD40 repeat protein/uncharacterized caspase-like protein